MNELTRQIEDYINNNIVYYHINKLDNLKNLKLKDVLKRKNNEFNIAYNNIIDNFSSKFDEEFCTEDRINWESILIFNSSEKSEQNESDK
jgi:hypothetical protein